MAKRPLQIPDRSEITDDTPLRLAVAAALAYPDGSMTASGLRKERDTGRLVTELTAGKEFTTLADIGRMRELCRRKVEPRPSIRAPRSSGDSDEEKTRIASAALMLMIERRKAADDAKRKAEREARQKVQGTDHAENRTRTGKPASAKRSPKPTG